MSVRAWQRLCGEWVDSRFTDDDLLQRGLVLGEESGEVLEAAVELTIAAAKAQRCILKAHQNIRGGSDVWLEALQSEVADVFFCLASIAHRAGFDLESAVASKWDHLAEKRYPKGAAT